VKYLFWIVIRQVVRGAGRMSWAQNVSILSFFVVVVSVVVIFVSPTKVGVLIGGGLVGCVFSGLVLVLRRAQSEERALPSRGWCAFMVFTWIVLLTVLFGDGYFVGLR